MKPIAKKGLTVIAVLYAIAVIGMVVSFVQRGRPTYPEAVTEQIQQSLNEIREAAFEEDEQHIRPGEISQREAAQVFNDLFVREGTIINVNYTLVLQALNFGILLLVLYGWLWDPMLEFIDKRRRELKEQLDNAEQQRAEARELQEKRQQELAELRTRRSEIIEKAREAGKQQREQIIEEAEADAERLSRQTRERLQEEFRRARQSLREEVADLTTGVAGRLLRREMKPEDHQEFIEQMIEQMELEKREREGAEEVQ